VMNWVVVCFHSVGSELVVNVTILRFRFSLILSLDSVVSYWLMRYTERLSHWRSAVCLIGKGLRFNSPIARQCCPF